MSKKKQKEKFVKPIEIVPKTPKQKKLFEAIKYNVVTTILGPAGTGKSYCPLMLAAKALNRGEIEKIILTKPNVDSGDPLGHFPGTVEEKLAVWLSEPLRILRNALGGNEVDCRIRNGTIQLIPFQTMRGVTVEDAFVLLEEAQNTTESQMELFTTRIGENVRIIINGDITQDDLHLSATGMKALIKLISDNKMEVPVIEFTEEDILRSGVCREFVINWAKYKKKKYENERQSNKPASKKS